MNPDASTPAETLLDQIDAQQDELLAQLDSLNARLEQVLKEQVLRDGPLGIALDAA